MRCRSAPTSSSPPRHRCRSALRLARLRWCTESHSSSTSETSGRQQPSQLASCADERAIQAASRLEHSLYRHAAAITTPSERSRVEIAKAGVALDKVHLLPSGTTQEWLDLGNASVERAPLGLSEDEFVWTYAGNIGLAQDLATAVCAAAELGAGYRLLVVGDGPLLADVQALAGRVAPERVRFTGLVPRATSGCYMRASDALLVSLANARGLEYAVPSKLYDCCAIGRPVIVAAAGEAHRLASAQGIALTVAPGDAGSLAAAVRRLREDENLRDELGAAGRRFAEQHLREHQADRLAAILASVLSR